MDVDAQASQRAGFEEEFLKPAEVERRYGIRRRHAIISCQAAMGHGRNGITFSTMAAQVLRGLVTGDGDPDSDLMSFPRDF